VIGKDGAVQEIDWPALRAAATVAMQRAYAPYSGFPVGVAGLVDDGRTVVGCNVENASYGVTLCAECGMVGALHAGGGGRLLAVACVDATGQPLMPCGRCRQLLWEHGGPECLLDAAGGPIPMASLLPAAFGGPDLDRVADAQAAAAPVPTRVERPADRGEQGPPEPGPVPARLAAHVGEGTAFVHPAVADGQPGWSGYWDRAGLDEAPGNGSRPGVLEEAPTWPSIGSALEWARTRTPRVVVVDSRGDAWWAGEGDPPAAIGRRWRGSGLGNEGER
jgi:cytidine deaminase